MASPRYTLNIKNDEPVSEKHVMTKKEKLSNFWFYYKWHIVGGITAAVMIFSFVYEIVSQVDPDYSIGIITAYAMPQEIKDALELKLSTMADDRNGDGRIVVTLNEFNFPNDGDATGADPNVYAANSTRLMGDIQTGDSMLFLTYDLEQMSEKYDFFAYNDGSTPEEGAKVDTTRMGTPWSECPKLNSLELGDIVSLDGQVIGKGQDIFKDMSLVKRAYKGTAIEGKKHMEEYYNASMLFYDKLTAK
ncbi:MAG: hypothetical protein RSA78_05280 [Oscillospiraceae bacterium]